MVTTLKNQKLKNHDGRVKKRLEERTNLIDIGLNIAAVSRYKILINVKHGRSGSLVEISENQATVLGICNRSNKKKIKSFESLINKLYNLNF